MSYYVQVYDSQYHNSKWFGVSLHSRLHFIQDGQTICGIPTDVVYHTRISPCQECMMIVKKWYKELGVEKTICP